MKGASRDPAAPGSGDDYGANDLKEDIGRIESAIHDLTIDGVDTSAAHRRIRDSLQSLAQIPPNTSLSLAETFEAVANGCSANAKRNVGLIMIRLVHCVDVLPKGSVDRAGRHIVKLIEDGCPSLLSKVLPNTKAQTHEKLAAVIVIHNSACERLAILGQQFSSLQDLNGRRQAIMKELNHGPTKNYLNAFGLGVDPELTLRNARN